MLNEILNNDKIFYIVAIVIILSGNLCKYSTPNNFRKIFLNDSSKIICISVIAYLSNINFNLSILLALILFFIMKLISDNEIEESFNNLETFNEIYKN